MSFDRLAQEQLFVSESWGMSAYAERYKTMLIDPLNGYAHGKRWFNITLTAWKEDISKGLLSIEELSEDFEPYIISKISKQ